MRKLGSSIAAFTLAMANWVDCTMTQICAADAPRAIEMRAADDYYPYYLLGNPDGIPTATRTDYSQSLLDWSRGCGYLGQCPGMSAAADDSCSEDAGSYDEELDCRGDFDRDDEDSLADDSAIDDSIPAPDEASYADDEDGYQAENDYQAENEYSEPSYSEPNYSEADDEGAYGADYSEPNYDAADDEGAYAADYGDDDASPQSPAGGYESDYDYDGYNYDYSSNYDDESSYGQQASDDDASEMIADDEEAAIAADESATTEYEATGEDDYVPSDEPCYGDYWTREYAAPAPAPATVEPAPQPNYGYDYENEYGDYEYNNTSDWSPEYAAPAEDEAPVADAGESWEDYSDEAELAPLDDTAPIAPAPVNDADDRLAEVVDAWATLPAPVKTVIMAMVKLSGSTR